jgi:hypothetical protein
MIKCNPELYNDLYLREGIGKASEVYGSILFVQYSATHIIILKKTVEKNLIG